MTNPKVFLLSMEIGGIKNLEKPVKVNFYKETIDNDFDPSKYRIKGIYGENGVGKSALMSGVSFYKELLINSRFLSLAINDKKLKYLLNKKSNKATFTFEFLLKIDKVIRIYKHSIELVKNENDILELTKEEAMFRTINSAYYTIYTVKNGILEFTEKSESNNKIIEFTKNTLKERTLISSLVTIDNSKENNIISGHLSNLYNFGVYLYVYINNNDKHNDYVVREYLKNSKDNVKNVLRSVALNYITCGERAIIQENELKNYRKYILELTKFIKIYKPNLKEIIIDEKPDNDGVSCGLIFSYDGYLIDGEFESTGVKKLVELFVAFESVSHGEIVFIDELDANIHDYYLCRLLEYVAEYTDGQLCFTSHNLGPMEVLKDYKKSIDFLSRDGEIFPWIKNGNYNVANQYKEGKIKNFPFNIDSFDYIKVFGDGE